MSERRYTTRQDADGSVVLIVYADCWLGLPGHTRRFWVPTDGGYVRETDTRRPGTLGRQVCEGLARTGSPCETTPEHLLACIRYEARACLRAQARSEVAL